MAETATSTSISIDVPASESAGSGRGTRARGVDASPASIAGGHRGMSRAVWRVWAIGLALILVAIGSGSLAIWVGHRATLAHEQDNMANLGLVLAEQTSRYVQVVDLLLQEVLARSQTQQISNSEQLRERLGGAEAREFLRAQVAARSPADAVVLVDAAGRIMNTSRPGPVTPVDLSDRDFYQYFKLYDDRSMFVSAPVHSRVTGSWTIYLSRRLDAPDGTFLGLVNAAIDVKNLVDFYRTIAERRHLSVTLLRRDGVLLARYPSIEAAVGKPIPSGSPWYARVAANGGTYRSPGYLIGVPSVVAVTPLHDYPLVLDASIREGDALAEWRGQAIATAIGMLGVVLALAVLFWIIARQIRQQEADNAALLHTTTALRTSESRLRDFAELASDWFWEQDAELRFVSITNESPMVVVGDMSYVGQTRWGMANADLTEPRWAQHKATLLARRPFRDFRYQRMAPDGLLHHVSINGTPLFDPAGAFIGYRGTGRDITVEVESEQELRLAKERAERAEAMLHDAVESVSEGFVIYDANDRLVTCNAAYRRTYPESSHLMVPGVRFVDVLRDGLAKGVFPEAVGCEEVWLADRLIRRQEAKGSLERQISSGAWIMISDRRMANGGLAGLRIDITALKQAQASLRDSERRLDRAQEMAGIGSWEFDTRTGRRVWSREMYRIRGFVPGSGEQTVRALGQYTHPDDRARFYEWLDRLSSGAPQEPLEYRILRPDGQERVVISEGQPVADASGRVTSVAGTLQDVTERRLTERQLMQAQKMETVGQLTGGVAHDFNNILGAVIGYIDLAAGQAPEGSALAEYCQVALEAALTGAELVKRLLAYSRRQSLHPRPTDIEGVIANVLALAERVLGTQYRIQTRIEQQLWPAHADTAQLESAMLNLIINARDAMPDGGTLTIEAANAVAGPGFATSGGLLTPGDYVVVAVGDSGQGMTPEVLGRAFEPFFTTKPAGAGSGLGLSMVFGTMQQLGGSVDIDSGVEFGTTVRLYLPRAVAGQPPTPEPEPVIEAQPIRGERVLLVEDNEQIRALGTEVLRELGCRVTVAESADAAIRLLQQGQRFDLVFTDIVMPGRLNGIGLAQAVREMDPAAHILFTSGFSSPETLREQIDVFGAEVIAKPYRKVDLVRVVCRILSRTAETAV